MQTRDPLAAILQDVLDRVNTLLESAGGHVELVDCQADAVIVRYDPGESDECPECVISDDTVKMFIRSALERVMPTIATIEIVR